MNLIWLKEEMDQKHSQTICASRCKFDGRKCYFRKKWSTDNLQFECKILIQNRTCRENYV